MGGRASHARLPTLAAHRPVVLEALRGVREHLLSYYDAQRSGRSPVSGRWGVLLSEDFKVGAVLDGVSFTIPLEPDFDLAALGQKPGWMPESLRSSPTGCDSTCAMVQVQSRKPRPSSGPTRRPSTRTARYDPPSSTYHWVAFDRPCANCEQIVAWESAAQSDLENAAAAAEARATDFGGSYVNCATLAILDAYGFSKSPDVNYTNVMATSTRSSTAQGTKHPPVSFKISVAENGTRRVNCCGFTLAMRAPMRRTPIRRREI